METEKNATENTTNATEPTISRIEAVSVLLDIMQERGRAHVEIDALNMAVTQIVKRIRNRANNWANRVERATLETK